MGTATDAGTGTVVGIDVGGTTVKAGRFAPDGQLLERVEVPTSSVGAEITTTVAAVAAQLRAGDTVAAAVVLPGIVDRTSGTVRWSVNLGWRDVPLRSLLEAELGVPVVVEHDVTAAALAEYDASGTDLLYVALGTGIGAANIVDGTVMAGASGLAGELGHVPVGDGGEACACGRTGCLEVYASAAGVARRYVLAGGRADATSADVVAAQGIDPLADRVWTEAVEALGVALATATLLLDPARIVLGGGLAGAGDRLAGPVAAALAAQLPWRPAPPVGIATLGADAGIHGAALLARRLAGSLAASGVVSA